ncbi:uncharacterized protein LOC124939832 [Impatiens glandulifera]|uniref:uncharacterized protein LOC124939832 n=1 Tax=Impatiens glandulifera TaxID=253017 RepID=UPI001FB0F6C8|nr:uncharacterized protein LOC124939832 [Impatiens glandulifera]
MNLLREAFKSHRLIRSGDHNQRLSSFLRNAPKPFSTEAPQQPSPDASSDSFLQSPTGVSYGRLTGMTKYTTKNDVINLLDECKLTYDDIKISYNRLYEPTAMTVQFSHRPGYDASIRILARKGRLYRMDRVDRSQWDSIRTMYGGRTVLLQGLPRTALVDDIERFLSGYQYDSKMQIFYRQELTDPVRMALVEFPSKIEATNAFITKNKGFCLNNQISMRVLE